jgi:predicted nucleotidyltransferase
MKRAEIIAKLREHEAELRALGVLTLSLFGSVARSEETGSSDVDVVVRLSDDPSRRGFAHYGRLEDLSRRLEAILGRPVDVVTEPIQKERLRKRVERDRALAF